MILGPTASGKSELGIHLAERLGGEVLVCDSTQVYRHFDIGTAKVPMAERRGIPHHLIDLVEPEEVFTAGDYRRRALEVLETVRGRRKVPIITAGTGLYLRALLEGLADAPARSEELRERLRKQAAQHGPEYLHRLLARLEAVDPSVFERLPGVSQVAASDHTLTITASGDLDAVVKAAARFRLHGLRSAKVDLDEVFHDYYRTENADAR